MCVLICFFIFISAAVLEYVSSELAELSASAMQNSHRSGLMGRVARCEEEVRGGGPTRPLRTHAKLRELRMPSKVHVDLEISV